MPISTPTPLTFSGRTRIAAPNPPSWVLDLFCGAKTRRISVFSKAIRLAVSEMEGHRFVRARVVGAGALDDAEFEQAACDAYMRIARELHAAPSRDAVRMWNYIPDIHRACANGLNRYMVFNSGRWKAFCQWFGACDGTNEFQRRFPTASGIGYDGEDLIVDALGMEIEGIPLENPRQWAACEYGPKYGPQPPCFARATVIPATDENPARLLIGGTASIRGQDSFHRSDLGAQIGETLENLQSLIVAASVGGFNFGTRRQVFDAIRELRVYYPRCADGDRILRTIRARFLKSTHIELLQASLCRQELLVEIEGIAVEMGTSRNP
jgi:chorismate lyase/3-hydroxybenzoate synthase